MNRSLLDSLLEQIDSFPKSLDNDDKGFFDLPQEQANRIICNEFKAVCGASQDQCELVITIGLELEKATKHAMTENDPEKLLVESIRIERKIEREVPENVYVCALQSVKSVKALYYHKKKNWNKALAATLECNTLNDYLVLQGIHSLALRMFVQNRNIGSILLKEQKFDRAYSLLFNLFDYLFNGASTKLYGNSFTSPAIWEKTEVLRERFIYDMFIIQLKDSVRFNFYNTESYLPSDWYLNLKFKASNTNRKIISDWIYINKKLRENNLKEYFIALTNFLSEPIISHYDILKLSLIHDFLKLLEKFDDPDKQVLKHKISFYLNDKLTKHTIMREIMIKKLNKQIRVSA